MEEKIFKRTVNIIKYGNMITRDRFICGHGIEYIWSIKSELNHCRYEHGLLIDYNTVDTYCFKDILKTKQDYIIQDLIQHKHKTGKWS